MQVTGLNHINIVTSDMARTVEFYESLLGMKQQRIPMATAGFSGCWIADSQGQPIIHVQAYNPERHGAERGGPTGKIDHIALSCEGFEDTRRRCEALGIDHKVNDRQYGNLRQVFVTDPNEISLELNFAED